MLRFRRRLLTGACLAAGLGLALGTAPAATATTARSQPPRAVVLPNHRPQGVQPRTAQHVTSTNWSGFADGAKTYGAVTSTWIQPEVACGDEHESYTVFWVGLDGYSSSTVEQAGVAAYCPGGGEEPVYSSWWEMYPTNGITRVFEVFPGDSVTATVRYTKPTFRLTVTDNTTGESFTKSERCGSGLTCQRSSAEWIAEAPTDGSTGERFNLAPFDSVRFGSDTASSGGTTKPVGRWPTYYRIDMVNTDGTVDATASALSAAGNSFTDVWHHE